MTQFIELTGRTEADAIAQALGQLGLERDDIRVEVLERAKTGFLGFGSKPAKIRVSYADKTEEVNLYADIKAEEEQKEQNLQESVTAQPTPEVTNATPNLEATQSIDAQTLATMLDQASSTVVPSIPLHEEEETTPEVKEMQEVPSETVEKVEDRDNSNQFNPSFLGSSPFPVVETSMQSSSQTEKVEEEQSLSVELVTETKEETKEETQEEIQEESVVSESASLETAKTQETQETPETQEHSEENIENTGDCSHPPKKLTKKERENLTAEEQEALTAEITRFLEGLMVHLNVTATPTITYKGLNVEVRLDGEGLATLIGKRGETLDSIQQITGYVIMKTCKKRIRLFLDAENYRAKREETLIKLAHKVAGEAVKNKRNVPLEPMNAYERHIIHDALSEHPNVFTYSTGSEPNRCTVVAVQGRKTHYKKNKKQKS